MSENFGALGKNRVSKIKKI